MNVFIVHFRGGVRKICATLGDAQAYAVKRFGLTETWNEQPSHASWTSEWVTITMDELYEERNEALTNFKEEWSRAGSITQDRMKEKIEAFMAEEVRKRG